MTLAYAEEEYEEPCLGCGRVACTCDRDYEEARDREVLETLTGPVWFEAVPLGGRVLAGWLLVALVMGFTRNPHAWPVTLACMALTGWLLLATFELVTGGHRQRGADL